MRKIKFWTVCLISFFACAGAAWAAVCFLPNYNATDGSCSGDRSFGSPDPVGGNGGGEGQN